MRRSMSFSYQEEEHKPPTGKLMQLGVAFENVVRRRNKKSKGKSSAAPVVNNKFEGASIGAEGPLHGRLLIIISIPFVPFVLYTIYVLFSSVWMSIYFAFLVFYLLLIGAYIISEVAIRPPWYHNNRPAEGLTKLDLPNYWQGKLRDPRSDMGLHYEDVEFPNPEGMVLRGWYIPASARSRRNSINLLSESEDESLPLSQSGPNLSSADGSFSDIGDFVPKVGGPAVVCVHGGGRDRRAWLRHCRLFHDAGWAVLLFDFAEHGISDGNRRGFTFGVREQGDVLFAAKFMREVKGHTKLAAVGTSVGGASVIMAGASRDHVFDCVVAENPVASADYFITGHVKRILGSYAPWYLADYGFLPFYWIVSWMFLFRIGSLFYRADALHSIAHLHPTPLLLMHGSMDDLVPPDHSELLKARAHPSCEYWVAENSWHCALYDMHPEEFSRRVIGFLDQHLLESN